MDEDEDEWYDSWTEEIRKEEKDDDAKMLFLKKDNGNAVNSVYDDNDNTLD
eukprot:CAMPEP_0170919242 /NCGR_PEP_ID=MMETSP0735-20130129/8467_1 /TAXON_ID=186038 /ORGANISM="Fragilariopsis kerguelensis, Strain L26-C5" /LENGTH=50 /DNA_ID=CAMNT_0011317885 /DNA_START=1012 /DNA_END=1165 /DNA_ORIENTATION=+